MLEHPDGTTYTGQFKVGHGCLCLSCPPLNLALQEGQFDGTGTLKQRDGSIYQGQFSGGVRSGKGQLQHEDGRSYDGDWVNGQRHGHGKWSDPLWKTSYEGSFEHGSYNGRGKLLVDGRVHYDGQWKAGRKDGKGLWQSVDGAWPRARERERERERERRFYGFSNGIETGVIKYTGGFSRDRRDGIGVLECGQWKYAGMWQDGKRRAKLAFFGVHF